MTDASYIDFWCLSVIQFLENYSFREPFILHYYSKAAKIRVNHEVFVGKVSRNTVTQNITLACKKIPTKKFQYSISFFPAENEY